MEGDALNEVPMNPAQAAPVGSLWELSFWMRPAASSLSFTDLRPKDEVALRVCWASNALNCSKHLRGVPLLSASHACSLSYPTKGHLAICDHFSQITEAQIKPKGLKNVMIVLMSPCYHSAGQQALAYVTPFCPKLIQCLRT